jgi:cyclomaltodextrinase / maltogenic alpha-amylase / neopullulanase
MFNRLPPRFMLLVSLAAVASLSGCAAMVEPTVSAPIPPQESLATGCLAPPLGTRALYLRGTFNNWRADDAQRLTWDCTRYVLVTRLQGSHSFKIGDEDWTPSSNWGTSHTWDLQKPLPLTLGGGNIDATLTGRQRWVFSTSPAATRLSMEDCPAPPLGDSPLFLRGTMNNWAALDEYAFTWNCDAYYLNVDLASRQEFKVADAAWKDALTLGAASIGASLAKNLPLALSRANDTGGTHNAAGWFDGEATLKLAVDATGKASLSIGPKTFVDGAAPIVRDPVALSLRFDSRQVNHKLPFGAVREGTDVNFAIHAAAGVAAVTLVIEKRRLEGNQEVLEYGQPIRIPLQRVPVAKRSSADPDRWGAVHRFDTIGIYGYYFEVDILKNPAQGIAGGVTTFQYQNNRDSVYWTRERGSNGPGIVEEKAVDTKRIRRFRMTVYQRDFDTPQWSKEAIYYYIFPDRFRNGNSNNDPKPGVTRFHDKTVEFHTDWNSRPFRPGSGDGSDAHYNNDFFGGDLEGIIQKLDYIAELGANVIYMTPVFRAASNHKYDTADYRNIDPAFGTNADFERLTREAQKRGIRVVPDTSLNHTGNDSVYFDRFGNFGGQGAFTGGRINRSSPYSTWFTFDPTQKEPDKQYKGWVGVTDLPEIDKSSPSFRNFAYRDRDSVMKLWLDRGAAGWRMDVAPWVPDDFWREWRTAIKSHRADAVTIAETWFDSSKYFLGDMFDSTMNYIFRNAVLDFANGHNAVNTWRSMELIREVYPPPAFAALMNLVSSHDQARALHVLGATDKASAAELAMARDRLRLVTFMQMVLPGAPAIYYGDEVGVNGGDDPYNRATYPWADRGGQPDSALLAEFKAMIAMRKNNPVVRDGALEAPAYIDKNVIAWVRVMPGSGGVGRGKVAIVGVNNAAESRTVKFRWPGLPAREFENAMVSGVLNISGDEVTLTVPPVYGVVWVSR